MADMMTFPDTVEEFMELYKITDTEQVYTNGAELVPIFRMKQWFDHKTGEWIDKGWDGDWAWQLDGRGNCWRVHECSNCHTQIKGYVPKYCPSCGSYNRGDSDDE